MGCNHTYRLAPSMVLYVDYEVCTKCGRRRRAKRGRGYPAPTHGGMSIYRPVPARRDKP